MRGEYLPIIYKPDQDFESLGQAQWHLSAKLRDLVEEATSQRLSGKQQLADIALDRTPLVFEDRALLIGRCSHQDVEAVLSMSLEPMGGIDDQASLFVRYLETDPDRRPQDYYQELLDYGVEIKKRQLPDLVDRYFTKPKENDN